MCGLGVVLGVDDLEALEEVGFVVVLGVLSWFNVLFVSSCLVGGVYACTKGFQTKGNPLCG